MEPPGTAPGSDPLITSAFMFIVPKDRMNIGPRPVLGKGFATLIRAARGNLVDALVPAVSPLFGAIGPRPDPAGRKTTCDGGCYPL